MLDIRVGTPAATADGPQLAVATPLATVRLVSAGRSAAAAAAASVMRSQEAPVTAGAAVTAAAVSEAAWPRITVAVGFSNGVVQLLTGEAGVFLDL